MKVECTHCGSRFNVDPALLGPKGRKLKCSQCKEVFFQPAPEPEPLPPPEPEPVPEPPPQPALGGTSLDDSAILHDTGPITGQASAEELEMLAREMAQQGEEAWEEDDATLLAPPPAAPTSGQAADDALPGEEEGEEEEEPVTAPPEGEMTFGDDDLARLAGEYADEGPYPAPYPEDEEAFPGAEEEEEDQDRGDLDRLEEIDLDDETLLGGALEEEEEEDLSAEATLEQIDLDMGDTLLAPHQEAGEEEAFEATFQKRLRDAAHAGGLPEPEMDLEEMAGLEDQPTILGERALSADEEDALGELGFNAGGLSADEEDALGELGFHGEMPLDHDDGEPITQAAPATTAADDALTQLETQARFGMGAQAEEEEEDEEYEEEAPRRNWLAVLTSFTPPGWLPWAMVVVLSVALLLGLVRISPMGDWLEYKGFDITHAFRLEHFRGNWRNFEFGQLLVVRGDLANTTRIARKAPMVKVSLMDALDNPLDAVVVAPGRVLDDRDLESGEETLRILVQLQRDVSRLKLPQVFPGKQTEFQAIFLNPPEGAVRYRVDLVTEEGSPAKLEGVRNFMSMF